MKLIFGNYGDNTIALIRWAYENNIQDLTVLNVDTGWAAATWSERVRQAKQIVVEYGFTPITICPKMGFAEQIIDRGQFPAAKFQWCAGFIKGLPLIDYADQHDPACAATIMMGSRRADSRARYNLPEYIDDSEHFGGRRVWYPLFNIDDTERNRLVNATGMPLLGYRSKECLLCVYSTGYERELLSEHDAKEVEKLESQLTQPIQLSNQNSGIEAFDLGCGAKYACGE